MALEKTGTQMKIYLNFLKQLNVGSVRKVAYRNISWRQESFLPIMVWRSSL